MPLLPHSPMRRLWPTPLGVMLLAAASSTALPVARWGDSALVLLLLPAAGAAYLAGRRTPSLAAAVTAIVAVLAASLPLSFLLPRGAPVGDWMASVLIALLTVVAPWWVGRYRLVRTEQRESDAAILADRAQAEERARIADDLHDTIGHELALIAVQAGSLELERGLTPRQKEQFTELRQAAVRATGHLRDVVHVMGPGQGGSRLDPTGGEGVQRLIEGARAAGMAIEADVDGSVLAAAHPLIAELMARAVREGLTNAARHARGATIGVDLRAEDAGHIAATVRSAAAGEVGDAGAGHGIPSLRRRAELLGGALDAAKGSDGGFALRLRAPLNPMPTARTAGHTDDPALRSNAQNMRRRVLQATAVPVALVTLVLAGFVAVQAVTVAQTAITSRVYDSIEIGDNRTELDALLPAGVPMPPPIVSEPPVPEGAVCSYFAARDGWLHFTDATYRLCFDDGRLIEKTVLGAS